MFVPTFTIFVVLSTLFEKMYNHCLQTKQTVLQSSTKYFQGKSKSERYGRYGILYILSHRPHDR
jgi:hypothetical protein